MKIFAITGEIITLSGGIYEIIDLKIDYKNAIYNTDYTVFLDGKSGGVVPDEALENTRTLVEWLQGIFPSTKFTCTENKVSSNHFLSIMRNDEREEKQYIYSSGGSIYIDYREPYSLTIGETICLDKPRNFIMVYGGSYPCKITHPSLYKKTGSFTLCEQGEPIQTLCLDDSNRPEYTYDIDYLFDNGLAFRNTTLYIDNISSEKGTIVYINDKHRYISLDNVHTTDHMLANINNAINDTGVRCKIRGNLLKFERFDNESFGMKFSGYLNIIANEIPSDDNCIRLRLVNNYLNPTIRVEANGVNINSNYINTGKKLRFRFYMNDIEYIPSNCKIRVYVENNSLLPLLLGGPYKNNLGLTPFTIGSMGCILL